MSLIASTHRASATFAGKDGRIAIQSDRGTEGTQIFTINGHGGDVRQLTHSDTYVTLPAFSRSGKRILFTQLVDHGGDLDGDVFVMRSNGSHQRNLTDNPAYDTSASFSPNGNRILFESDRTGHDQLFIMHADGSHQHRITHDSLDNDDPVFFPSGRKIAFEVFSGGNRTSTPCA